MSRGMTFHAFDCETRCLLCLDTEGLSIMASFGKLPYQWRQLQDIQVNVEYVESDVLLSFDGHYMRVMDAQLLPMILEDNGAKVRYR